MLLRAGITGFRDLSHPPLPECDFKQFKADCFSIARRVGGKVISIESPVTSQNFSAAVIEWDLAIRLVLNAHFPIVGFAAITALSIAKHDFVDCEVLAAGFREIG